MPAIETTQLRKVYPIVARAVSDQSSPLPGRRRGQPAADGILALDGLDLEVRDGEFFGLLGPNGAGKTTTIGILTTRIRATGGRAAQNVHGHLEQVARVRRVPLRPAIIHQASEMEVLMPTVKTACLVAVVAAGVAGCQGDAPSEPETVQLALIEDAAHGGAPMTTSMTQEVTHTPAYAGDPVGSGTALLTISVGQGEVCWDITVENLTAAATAAHIHQAPAGVRGGIVVFLSAPGPSGTSRGCATDLDRALLKDILQNAADYYVNVHTTAFPAGAVRGQLD